MTTPRTTKRFQLLAKANGEAELVLYGEIDAYFGIAAKQVREDLKAMGDVKAIHVRLNSEGGNVFDGLAIYNTLREHPAAVTVHVDGMALSIASIIAMAGDAIVMAEGAYMMLHNPAMFSYGDAEDHEQAAALLASVKDQLLGIYSRRTGLDAAAVAELMAAETWLDADAAIAKGFATRKTETLAVAASIDTSRFANAPKQFHPSNSLANEEVPMPNEPTPAPAAPAVPQPAAYHDLKTSLPEADAAFLCEQLEARATLAQAQAAWTTHLADQLKARDTELAALKAQAAKPAEPPAAPNGVQPLGSAGAGTSTPVAAAAQFEQLVNAAMAAGSPRHRAVRDVARRNPDLRQAWVEEANAGR